MISGFQTIISGLNFFGRQGYYMEGRFKEGRFKEI